MSLAFPERLDKIHPFNSLRILDVPPSPVFLFLVSSFLRLPRTKSLIMPESSPETTSETKAPTILERIYAQRAKDVELAKSTPGTTPEDMKVYLDELKLAPPLISFVDRLKRNPGQSRGI